MSRKAKPSDILAKPSDAEYRKAVKDFVASTRKLVFKPLQNKGVPSNYQMILLLGDLTAAFYNVMKRHSSYVRQLTVYEVNCDRMDDKK